MLSPIGWRDCDAGGTDFAGCTAAAGGDDVALGGFDAGVARDEGGLDDTLTFGVTGVAIRRVSPDC